jgi:hypothetical protein
MAINATYYIDADTFDVAASVYLDINLEYIAPDGFYKFGTITRQQSSGILLPQEDCETCGTPCGETISASGVEGIYQINLDAGSLNTGAIIIIFNPQAVPDGIRATYDGVVYNKLSSPVDGLHQSSNYGNFTIVGDLLADCGMSGGTTLFPDLVEKLYNGIEFVNTGNTQSVIVYPGDVSLSSYSAPGQCVMVIPKPSATPNNVFIEMIGPCSGTGFDIEIYCPVALPSFISSNVFPSSTILCGASMPNTFYFAKVHSTIDVYVGLYDYVFTDANGEFALADGYYMTSNVAVPNQVLQIVNGIVVAIVGCSTPS